MRIIAKSEAKITFTAQTSEFNENIKKANAEMSKLRAEAKLNETQMRATGTTIEGLENKYENLKAQLKEAENKTEALNQKVEEAVKCFGEDSVEVTKLKTQLANAQTAEEKIRQAIDACNTELDEQKRAAAEAENAHETLADTIKRQQKELDDLKSDYIEVISKYGETSDEAKDLERAIGDLSSELKQNKSAFSEASNKANELDVRLGDIGDSAENAGDSAEGAGDGFTVLKGIVADLASNAIQMAIGKISEFVGYLSELPAETMELRQDFATLTTSFDNMGFSTETATETWKDLYAVFGEDDRAVETANHISKIAENQEELNEWVTITTGVWGTYQDSLPVEGLAEAANETIKTGQVTGVLADALNWSSEASQMFAKYMSEDVTTAEDAFNVALSECTTEQERQQLITETLTTLYGDAAETYRDTAGAQMEAKEATADNIIVEAELADTIEPVTTAFTELKTSLLESLTPAIETVSGLMLDALEWAREHPVAMQVLAGVIGTLATAFSILAIGLGIYATAQFIANSAFAGFIAPTLLVIAAIAAVVAIVIVVINYWDEIVIAVKNCWENVKTTLSQWGNWIDTNVIQPVKQFFVGLWESVQAVWNTICDVVQFAILIIGEIISTAFTIITIPFRFIWENCKEIIISAWETIKEAVSTAIDNVLTVITTVMNAIQTFLRNIWNDIKTTTMNVWNNIKAAVSNVVNSIKNTVSNVFNAIKTVVSNVWNGIKSTTSNVWNSVKSAVSNVVNNIKSVVTSGFQAVKSATTSIWNSIKSAITTPINNALSTVKDVIGKLKDAMNFSWSLPHLKTPHFSVSGGKAPWGFGGKGSLPSVSVSWYAKGGLFTKPTIIPANGFGEGDPEYALPLNETSLSPLANLLGDMIMQKMNSIGNSIPEIDYDRLANAMSKQPIYVVYEKREFGRVVREVM